MQVYDGLQSVPAPPTGAVVTIGNFDGVHRGHQRMLATARAAAREWSVPLLVLTFEPHPVAVLRPERAPERLTTHHDKLNLLAAFGVDAVVVLHTEPALLELTADEFVTRLVQACRPRLIVEGPSFFYGRARGGNIDTLRAAGRTHGFDVRIVDAVRLAEHPDDIAVSSSAIRAALETGDVATAAAMLSRPHRIVGRVGAGAGRGAKLGLPTVNLHDIPQMRPAAGVYAAAAQLADGSLHLAAVNVGPAPTFDVREPQLEAHLLDYATNLRGQRVGLHFFARLRGQVRFADSTELVAQVRQDITRTREHAESLAELPAPIPL